MHAKIIWCLFVLCNRCLTVVLEGMFKTPLNDSPIWFLPVSDNRHTKLAAPSYSKEICISRTKYPSRRQKNNAELFGWLQDPGFSSASVLLCNYPEWHGGTCVCDTQSCCTVTGRKMPACDKSAAWWMVVVESFDWWPMERLCHWVWTPAFWRLTWFDLCWLTRLISSRGATASKCTKTHRGIPKCILKQIVLVSRFISHSSFWLDYIIFQCIMRRVLDFAIEQL